MGSKKHSPGKLSSVEQEVEQILAKAKKPKIKGAPLIPMDKGLDPNKIFKDKALTVSAKRLKGLILSGCEPREVERREAQELQQILKSKDLDTEAQ